MKINCYVIKTAHHNCVCYIEYKRTISIGKWWIELTKPQYSNAFLSTLDKISSTGLVLIYINDMTTNFTTALRPIFLSARDLVVPSNKKVLQTAVSSANAIQYNPSCKMVNPLE